MNKIVFKLIGFSDLNCWHIYSKDNQLSLCGKIYIPEHFVDRQGPKNLDIRKLFTTAARMVNKNEEICGNCIGPLYGEEDSEFF